MTFSNTDFVSNNSGSGGALYAQNNSPTIVNGFFASNEAVVVGAIYTNGGGARIANTVFSGNAASSDGGALYNTQNSSPDVRNVTFANNTATGQGGAVFNGDSSGPSLLNSIFWENEAQAQGNQIYNGTDSTPLVANTLIQGGVPESAFDGGGNSTGNPNFENADGPDGTVGTADDNLMLTDGSAALDLGDNSRLPDDETDLDEDGDTGEQLPLDLAGEPRVVDNNNDDATEPQVDAGAYEAPSSVVIPVELTTFEATADGGAAVLTWHTASETNNAGFAVQRKTDAGAFERVGYREGAGTTAEEQRYQFRTNELTAGEHVFRLKQVDHDGVHEYSDEVAVRLDVSGTHELSVYPNPIRTSGATMDLAVSKKQSARVVLYDMMGRQVATLHDATLPADETKSLSLDASELSSGVYVVRVQGNGFVESRKVVVTK